MKLLYTNNSPYARKVRVVASEKHIELDLQEVVLADANCIVKDFNPLGKVPTLILSNGDSLYDSSVIVEYLDKKSPVANLIPVDQALRVDVKRWEALADGVCDAAVTVMLEKRRHEDKQDAAVLAKQMDKVMRGLTTLEKDYAGKTWCVDNKYSLADISVGCMLGYVSLRFDGQLDIAADFPNLMNLHDAMLERPIFAQTKPQPKV